MGFSQEASKITHNTKAFLSNPTGSIIEHMAISTDPATKELSMLSYIDQNSDATQRELSEHIGVSLGTINIMVKQLVRKGLIKIVRLQPNSARYFLTPQGIASKIERTCAYITRTYREVALFRFKLTNALKPLVKPNPPLVFFGPNDELAILLKEITESEFSHLKALFISTDEVNRLLSNTKKENSLIITWKTEADQILRNHSMAPINVLTQIGVMPADKEGIDNAQ